MLLIKVGLIKNPHKVILSFNLTQWMYFSQLISKGYSLRHTLQLLNKDDKHILIAIEKGESIEKITKDSCKGRLGIFVSFFLNTTSIANALQCAIAMYQFERDIRKKFTKQTAYPLFILIVSFFSVIMFSNVIIPQLIQNFEIEGNTIFVVVSFINYVSLGLLILFLLFVLIIVMCKFSKKLMYYIGLFSIRYIRIVREWMSYYLSNYLVELDRHGMSTKHAFQFLQDVKNQPLLFIVVKKIYYDLQNGVEMMDSIQHNPMISKNFKLHYTLGSSTNTFRDSLITYRDLQEKQWVNQIRKISVLVQLISYSFVGILVICVYQIMLVPLQMLERM